MPGVEPDTPAIPVCSIEGVCLGKFRRVGWIDVDLDAGIIHLFVAKILCFSLLISIILANSRILNFVCRCEALVSKFQE
ncbi:hypothetical protein HOY82DRAFT_613177 [Tuber indicum]|nr:hypothetical protein HOY82DRAFT_613177 [Tuber indicum]